ncbi:MAG: YceD family protein, partial [Desulfobacca sp.]|uniref:YceD family protein n=1 Tax=Desulfobacca sp. TaxID=2067990 RepID=UPI00404B0784
SILCLLVNPILPGVGDSMKNQRALLVPRESITWEGVDVLVLLEAEWFARWQEDEPGLEFALQTPFRGTIHLERHDGTILLRGQINGELACTCSRCLDTFAQPVAITMALLVKIGGPPKLDAELELSADDLDEEYVAGDYLDLDALLREQILLALPLKPLCQENCLGLCRRCGANLNREACTCRQPEASATLAALANLQKKK